MKRTIPIRFAALLILSLTIAPVFAVFVTVWEVTGATCGNPTGTIEVNVFGGTEPYTFLWSDGNTSEDRTGLLPGIYWVTVTDALGATASVSATVEDSPALNFSGGSYAFDGVVHLPCPGQSNGQVQLLLYPESDPSMEHPGCDGVPPYSVEAIRNGSNISPLGFSPAGNPRYGPFARGEMITFHVTDAAGCAGDAYQTIGGPLPLDIMLSDVAGTCTGGTNGSLTFVQVQEAQGWLGGIRLHDEATDVVGSIVLMTTHSITGLAAGTYTPEITYGQSGDVYCEGEFLPPVIVPDLGMACGEVSGTLYLDHDQDCTQDSGEPGLPYRTITFTPGPTYVITDVNGHFTHDLPNGNFTAEVTGADLYPVCPAVQPIPFTITTGPVALDIADSSLIPMDLKAWMAEGAARPGFEAWTGMTVTNLGGQASGPIEATLTFDPLLTLVAAEPVPTAVAGNVISWSLPSLSAFARQVLSLSFSLPADPGSLGSTLVDTFTCSSLVTDADPANNTVTNQRIVTGSYDPNDKLVRTASSPDGSSYVVDADEELVYTIRFQNTGTDTAFTVVVRDTLSDVLDLATFKQGIASHDFTVVFKPDNVVEWTFANILLPDSNTNEAASHGLVSFSIRPLEPALPGIELHNAADIFFDFNPPVRTPDAITFFESTTGIASSLVDGFTVHPNPANERITIAGIVTGIMPQVRLTTADGRTVIQRTLPNDHTLDIQALKPGIYLLQVGERTVRVVKY